MPGKHETYTGAKHSQIVASDLLYFDVLKSGGLSYTMLVRLGKSLMILSRKSINSTQTVQRSANYLKSDIILNCMTAGWQSMKANCRRISSCFHSGKIDASYLKETLKRIFPQHKRGLKQCLWPLAFPLHTQYTSKTAARFLAKDNAILIRW